MGGPKTDEESKMTRIRGRGTVNGKTTEGWLTVSGSNGTEFLKRVDNNAPQKKSGVAKKEKPEEKKDQRQKLPKVLQEAADHECRPLPKADEGFISDANVLTSQSEAAVLDMSAAAVGDKVSFHGREGFIEMDLRPANSRGPSTNFVKVRWADDRSQSDYLPVSDLTFVAKSSCNTDFQQGDEVRVLMRKGVISLDLRPDHNFVKVVWQDNGSESELIPAECIDGV